MGLSSEDLKILNSGCIVTFRVPPQRAWSNRKRIKVIRHKRSFSSMAHGLTNIKLKAVEWKMVRQPTGKIRQSSKLSGFILIARKTPYGVKYRNVEVHVRDQALKVDHIFKATIEFSEPSLIWITEE